MVTFKPVTTDVTGTLTKFAFPERSVFNTQTPRNPQQRLLIKTHSPFLNPKLLNDGKRRRRHPDEPATPNTPMRQDTFKALETVEYDEPVKKLSRIDRTVERLFPKSEIE